MTHPDWRQIQRDHLFFTWTRQAASNGWEIDAAEGARFHVPGRGWIWDLESQVYNVNAGHNHPHIKRRMVDQINELPAAAPGAVLPIRATLAEKLVTHTGLERAFLTTGGSEAVENAIKIARLFTGRRKILARRHSYHGATFATLAIGGDARKDPFVADLSPSYHIDDPYPLPPRGDGPSAWLASVQRLVAREGPDTIAAILLEGLTGTNGVQIPPDDFWPGVRQLCDEHRILLIDDEIFSGFGRTGRWFACEHWQVRPDIMVIGKGLTSGYAPLAGVMVNREISEYFVDQTLWCGLTHYAHPVSCAAAVGAVEVLEHDKLVENAASVGQHLFARVAALRDDAVIGAHLVDVRGRGLMLAVEFDRAAESLVARLWARNVYCPARTRTLFLCPPLCLTRHQADQVADLLVDAAREEFASG
ncbi:MAG: aspartate aminotransferase family protein [Myxococcales bacterium FL481]|nr:MAG: aspartate aminotransferase family protein [Myxococcales bacterium FL481]